MLQLPSPSYIGQSINSFWYLEIMHKHDAWNEFGDGTIIQVPLHVIQNNIDQGQFMAMNE